MNKLALLVFVALLVAYPVLVYFGREQLSPAAFGLLLILLVVGRFVLGQRDAQQITFGMIILVYCLLLAWLDSTLVLRLYPVLISLVVAAGFLYSLTQEESLIERMARLGGTEITPARTYYMRRLTLAWGIVISANGVMAAYTACCTTWKFWAFYNGVLSYSVMALLFVIEYIFRHFYRKRVGSR